MIYLSLIIAIIGAIVYLLGDKLPTGFGELGRLAFLAGLVAFLFGH